MTCRHAPSPARLILLVLFIVAPQLSGTAPVWGEAGAEGRTTPFLLSLPPLGPLRSTPVDRKTRVPEEDRLFDDPLADPTGVLAVLLEALDHPGATEAMERREGHAGKGQSQVSLPLESWDGEIKRTGEAGGERRAEERLRPGFAVGGQGDDVKTWEGEEGEEKRSVEEKEGQLTEDAGAPGARGDQQESKGGNYLGRVVGNARSDSISQGDAQSLQRKIRGYFQNIDLGLQDNEILPPLKGYKAYNTQLARAGKKLHWQEAQARNTPFQGGNFMDDFDADGGQLEEEEEDEEDVEEEEESLSRAQEEARARAEKQEVLRQQEEAERAREEEQRLADIASDVLMQYMGRKQQGFVAARRKGGTGAEGNTAEDKRSEEEEEAAAAADLDQQMIDRLIEISSKLHLPADDVVEIISDVEEKKKKRKELQQQPSNSNPVAPRFRPLVPPPLAVQPVYHYTVSSNPKKAPYKYKPNKKWQKDKAKAFKQDFWYKPQNQLDFWYKPQKQFLAFPSYPYYQKPYRAYYPVLLPYPKQRYYGKPTPSRDWLFGPQDFDLQTPQRRKHRAGNKARRPGWRQQSEPRLPLTPYISNYILPHPRTYQPLPPPKPVPPASRRGRRPPYRYPPVTAAGDDYEEDGLVPQLDSEEELENFIERIYMKRRMY